MTNYIRKPRKQKRWPESISVATCLTDHNGALAAWACGDIGENRYVRHWGAMTESDCELFLQILRLPSQGLSGHLVIMSDAYAMLTAMGFWKAVKSKKISLRGTDERQVSAPRCLVEDPPTIVHYGVPGKPGSGVICDMRNWNFSFPENVTASCTVNDSGEWDQDNLVLALSVKLKHMELFVSEYESLLESASLGTSWRMTSGSQAFFGFRSNYMETPIESSRCGDEVESLTAKSIYGGRCECFRIGNVAGPVYQYDVNQLYSAMAVQRTMPTRFMEWSEKECVKDNPYPHIAECIVTTKQSLFPYRTMEDSNDHRNLVIWPVGAFKTVLAGPELALAVRHRDCQIEIIKAAKFHTEPILSEWAKSLWMHRKQSAKSMSRVVKSLALSLYGKFSQRQRDWIIDPDDMAPLDMDVGDWYSMGQDESTGVIRHRILDGKCMREVKGEFMHQSSPPISAFINSAARVHLMVMMELAECVYYCDTDSLWTNRVGHEKLVAAGAVGPQLGGLRLVGEWEWVNFLGIKHYEAEGTLYQSGVPEGATRVGTGHYEWKQPVTFNGSMHSREYPTGKIVVRSFRGNGLYKHGIPQESGWVDPHLLRLENA